MRASIACAALRTASSSATTAPIVTVAPDSPTWAWSCGAPSPISSEECQPPLFLLLFWTPGSTARNSGTARRSRAAAATVVGVRLRKIGVGHSSDRPASAVWSGGALPGKLVEASSSSTISTDSSTDIDGHL